MSVRKCPLQFVKVKEIHDDACKIQGSVVICQYSERPVAKGVQVDAIYPLGSAKYQGQTCWSAH